MSSHELVLAGEGCVARLVPHEGARVQSLIDSTTGREVLYRRHPQESSRKRFAACSTGGWDMLFPNDSAWRDFPDHGSVWSSSFTVERSDSASTVVRTELDRPAVEIVQSFTLLPRPRRGLNLSTTLRARSATSPFLLAYHPMLAIGEGWRIEGVGDDMTADDELPGRFSAGPLDESARIAARVVPPPANGLAEVIYANRCGEAVVRSPDGRSATRVSWDAETLPSLWIVAVPPSLGNDQALLFEPCTSRPFRLEDAITAGTACSLPARECLTAWCEVESLDVS